MQVEQISVFLENKAGRIADVTSILARAGINIRALSLADTSDFGVLRLIVDDHAKAEAELKKNHFTMGKTFVVAVEVEDKPGGLHRIMGMLGNAGLNVEYMYAFVRPHTNNAVMIFRFDKIDEAITLLLDNGVNVIEGEKLYAL